MAAAAAAPLVGASSTFSAPLRRKQPNVLIVVADDMRYDSMGFIDKDVITPNLDAFAGHGVRFRNAFATTSTCCTSRASIFTGTYARRHGVWDFETDLSPDMRTISYPVMLKKLGYKTGFLGKYGLCDYDKTIEKWEDRWGATITSRAPDFDVFDSSDATAEGWHSARDSTQSLSRKAVRFLESHDEKQPFCLSVSFLAPHANDLGPDPITGEYSPELDMLAKYEDLKTVPLRPMETVKPEQNIGIEKYARTLWQRRFSDPSLRLDSLKKYYAMISGIDRAFGQICDALKQRGTYEDTLIIFMSDHGYLMGDYSLDGKWIAFESSIRIPLLIKPPHFRVGADCNDIALNIDICPTIVAAAGGQTEKAHQGADLATLWKNRTFDRDEFLYEWGPNPRTGIRALRDRRYTYIEYNDETASGTHLYDRAVDPAELHDIAGKVPSLEIQRRHERLLDLIERNQ